jgi:hypothetical protein
MGRAEGGSIEHRRRAERAQYGCALGRHILRVGLTGGLNRIGGLPGEVSLCGVGPVQIEVTTVGRAAAPRALVSTIDAYVEVARQRSRTGHR